MNPSSRAPSAAGTAKLAPSAPRPATRTPRGAPAPGANFRAQLGAVRGAVPAPSPAAAVAMGRGNPEDPRPVHHRDRQRQTWGDGDGGSERGGMTSFAVPPAVLMPPGAVGVATSPAATQGAAQVETAALIERFVTSMRVGRVGKEHAVHMKLRVGRTDGVEVRLSSEGSGVSAVLRSDAADRSQVEKLAASLGDAFAARGIKLERIRIESP